MNILRLYNYQMSCIYLKIEENGRKKNRRGAQPLIFHLAPPNPTFFTRIDPLVFKFSTSIVQGTTLSLPPILFVLQICEHCGKSKFHE